MTLPRGFPWAAPRAEENLHRDNLGRRGAPQLHDRVREDDIAFEVIERIWRKRAVMAIVVQSGWVPRPKNIAGVITKEHVADSVAASVRIYPS
jgi:hypothetical protein